MGSDGFGPVGKMDLSWSPKRFCREPWALVWKGEAVQRAAAHLVRTVLDLTASRGRQAACGRRFLFGKNCAVGGPLELFRTCLERAWRMECQCSIWFADTISSAICLIGYPSVRATCERSTGGNGAGPPSSHCLRSRQRVVGAQGR